MSRIRVYISLILTLFVVQAVQSQSHTETESFEQKIYFREGYRYVYPSFRDNLATLNNLKASIDNAQAAGTLLSVEIRAWASPDGTQAYNERLARNRTDELVKWILGNCRVGEEKIKKTSGGIGWDILRDLLLHSDRPYKEAAIDIIDHTPVWVKDAAGNIVTGRKKKLMDHDYGRTWQDMRPRFFSDIRGGLVVVVSVRKQEESPVPDAVEEPAAEAAVAAVPEPPQADAGIAPADTLPLAVAERNAAKNADRKPFYMAVRSDMLEDLLLIPNVGVEFHLGKQWSIAANWKYAWWDIDSKDYFWRIYGGDLTLRKYFGSKAKEKPLQGHHIGIYAQALTYDFELGGKGILGGMPGGTLFDKLSYGAGIEYGYSLPAMRRLNVDFSIGLGYLGGEYQEYTPEGGNYLWQATKHRHYWGPTKAEISLVWLLGRGNVNAKKGGGK